MTKLTPSTLLLSLCLAILPTRINAQTVVDFESLPVPAAGFFNGDTTASSPYRDNFTARGTADNFGSTEFLQTWAASDVEFFNSYTPDFGSWNGFSWSQVTDTTTAGFTNQYASFAGGGSDGVGGTNGGETYAVAFGNRSYFNLPDHSSLLSVDITNATYAGIAMRDGDSFAKKFGGDSGNDEDTFQLLLTGYDSLDLGGSVIGTKEIFLADYRFSDNSLDYILDTWQTTDLTSLGNARSVGFTFSSTDIGAFGPNTPLYAALDNLSYDVTAVPEPASLWGLGFAFSGALTLRRRRRQT